MRSPFRRDGSSGGKSTFHLDASNSLRTAAENDGLMRALSSAAPQKSVGSAPFRDERAAALVQQGDALKVLGRALEALAAYDNALAVKPGDVIAHNNRGNLLRALGRCSEALKDFDRALAAGRTVPELWNNRGGALSDLARFSEALVSFDKALALRPKFPSALVNRGDALMKLARPAEALASYEASLAQAPDNLVALNNCGEALRALGRPTEALARFDRALALDPDLPEALNNRGGALCNLERYEEALAVFDRALAIRPQFADALGRRGGALQALGRATEALASCEAALALKPDCVEALVHRGEALMDLDRPEEAMGSLDQAIRIAPAYADAHESKGVKLMLLGRTEEAAAALERAVAAAPERSRAYYHLSLARRARAADPLIDAMERLLASPLRSLDDQCWLHFALGKVLADVSDHEAAFRHLLSGNAIKHSRTPYDAKGSLDDFERLKTNFTAEAIERNRGAGDPSQVPIFILGMPRSGSTLIEQIFASHSQVSAAGEARALGAAIEALRDELRDTQGARPMARGDWRRLGADYLRRLGPLAKDAPRVTDKMPDNFRFIGAIHLALPNAAIIHLQRDPLDVCLSCFSTLFQDNLSYSYDLADLGRYYRAYENLMAHWRAVLPQGVILDVRYEDLVDDLEGQARRMIAHCGLEWEPRCLDFHKTDRIIKTASMSQVRQPIYKSSIGRWRRYEAHLGPLVAALRGDE
jgi:tetratricopeptide (TPR) repeat protein